VPVEITAVSEVTDELVSALTRLLPQLSASAPVPDQSTVVRVVGSPTNTVLVARIGGDIVGTLTLVAIPLMTGLQCHIKDVVVDTAVRGSGVGAALVTAAVQAARDAGADSIELTSRPSRVAANRLYQRLGFQPRETNVYRYPLGG
jgi:ribosomal protein S18 acetylase RimI-like enzyme